MAIGMVGARLLDGPNTRQFAELSPALFEKRLVALLAGGEGGIRTHGTVARTPHFECGAFDHSATSPLEGARPVGDLLGRRRALAAALILA